MEADAMLAKRREQCRRNQARYQERQSQYTLCLEEEVAKVQRQISSLENEREVMTRCLSMRSNVWGVAVEYFRLFHNGYKAPELVLEFAPESNVQLDFLRAAMAPDVTDGNVHGIDALMEQWRLYSLSHGDLRIVLERVERGPHDGVVATSTTSMTITEDSIAHAFPHLLKDHIGRSLASRLLGWRFSMRGSVCFA